MSRRKWVQAVLFVMLLLCAGWVISKMPPQELKIIAVTQVEDSDMIGSTDVWYPRPLEAGKSYTAVIKFIAVKNSSGKLFTSCGTGQFVYLGCGELTGECNFISLGRFIHVRLNMDASQKDLKLEDGTPFDITRYSLKPVITIKE